MKKIVVIVFALGILFAAFAAGRSFAQKPPVALMVELPSDMEQNNPVPMTLHWDRGEKSYYYFSWGEKSTGGYRLEYDGFVKNVMTIKAISPGYQQMVAQVLTYPKLLLELPKGNYVYRIVDDNGKEISSAFKTKQPSLGFSITLPINGQMTARRIWRGRSAEGKNKAAIALDALLAQPEMGKYTQLKVEGVECHQEQCKVKMGESFTKLEKNEQERLGQAIKATVMGLKLKGIRKVDIITGS